MENTKKIGLFFILLFFLNSCSQDKYAKIGDHLYKDKNKNIYIKVKNVTLLHPSKDIKSTKDSIYLSEVYDIKTRVNKPLKEILDEGTFKKVNEKTNYFKDKRYIYVYKNSPKPHQFYHFVNKNSIFFGRENDYLQVDEAVYYRGIELDKIDVKKASLFYVFNKSKTKKNEFYGDGKVLYIEDVVMDLDHLDFLDLIKKVNDSLKANYFK